MKKLMTTIIAALAAMASLSVRADDNTQNYISKWSSTAVAEMYRSGVPASITLSQGILESNSGQSRLAREGNNHFGIKCHSDWKGDVIYNDDDAKHECFRKYANAAGSYRDHSDFLRFKSRYAFLFELDTKDYKGWAHGLRRAGYATDPKYAHKLINLIQTYDLSRFDSHEGPKDAAGIPDTPRQLEQPQVYKGTVGESDPFYISSSRTILRQGKTPFIYAREGETYRTIAPLYHLFPKELAAFNEDDDPSRHLVPGEIVYLQKKARFAPKGLEKHVCAEGEDLRGISQRYGVRMKSLMKLNGIDEPAHVFREDDTVFLRRVPRK